MKWIDKKHMQNRYLWLLIGQLLFFISVSKVDSYEIQYSKLFFAVSTSVILVLGLLTITNVYLRRYGFIITSAVVLLSMFGVYQERTIIYLITFVFYFVVILILTTSITTKLLKADKIDYTHISGSIAGFLMIPITLTLFLRMLFIFNAEVLSEPMATLGLHGLVYFSLLAVTKGYAEVIPVMPQAQMITALFGVAAQFYIAVVVAIIIGKMMNSKANSKDSL